MFFKERVPPATAAREASPRSVPAPAPSSRAAKPSAESPAGAESERARTLSSDSDYAATGMGRSTDHAVTRVWLDLEDKPAHTVNIRYEYRAQLVRLGILPRVVAADPLQRRERAQGFEGEYCPETR